MEIVKADIHFFEGKSLQNRKNFPLREGPRAIKDRFTAPPREARPSAGDRARYLQYTSDTHSYSFFRCGQLFLASQKTVPLKSAVPLDPSSMGRAGLGRDTASGGKNYARAFTLHLLPVPPIPFRPSVGRCAPRYYAASTDRNN